MGDTIMVRSFTTLPRLEDVAFLRPASRYFITGRGPFPALIRPWLVMLLFGYGALFGAAAIVITAIAYQAETFLGHPLSQESDWLRLFGPILLVPAVIDLGIALCFQRLAEQRKQLAAEGGLLPGELLSAKLRAAKGGNYLQFECQFTSPQGQIIVGKRNGPPDRRLKNAPPAGSKLLILYDSDRLWQVL
jgi:hypothetical protein